MSASRQVSSPRELLVPYVEWLRNRCLGMDRAEADRGGETKVSFGQRSLSLDSWELERLRETFGDRATSAEHCVLLVEIVALLLKCMADSERFAAASAGSVDQFYRLQAELMLDSNLGNSLIGRTQRAVDSLVQQGMTQEARQFSGTMHKLRRSLIEVNRAAGTNAERTPNENHGPTIATSREIVERLAEATDEPATYPGAQRGTTTPAGASVARPESPAATTARTRVLAVVFVLAFVIWIVAVEFPKFFGFHPPQFRISDLQLPVEPLAVHSRWPSLYVEARGEAWSALRPEERRRLVTDLVERASERGFTSILVRTADGRPLAQWWRGRDVRWIDPANADPPVSAGSSLTDTIETGQPAS